MLCNKHCSKHCGEEEENRYVWKAFDIVKFREP